MNLIPRLVRLSALLLLCFLAAPLCAADSGSDSGGSDDNDAGVLKFDQRSFEVLEEAGVAVIVVERSKGDDGAVSVDVSTADGTATSPDDYAAISTTLSWGDGDETSRILEITIVDDDVAEGKETIELTLSSPTGGAAVDVERGQSVLVIQASDGGGNGPGDDPGDDGEDSDNDGERAGVLKFDQRSFFASEEAAMALITVERSHGEDGEVSVTVTTMDGTATEPEDYQAVLETLVWSAGDGSVKAVKVPISNDDMAEGAETVHLLLSDATGGATIDTERGEAVLTILDGDATAGDDPDRRAGALKFDERSFQVAEDGDEILIGVERSGGALGAVTVDFETADGSARAGIDYAPVSGTLTWAAGDETTKFFTVSIFDDSEDEGSESVHLLLSDPTGGAELDRERSQSLLHILDDDSSVFVCAEDDTTLCLLGERFEVEVVWRTSQGESGRGHVIPLSDESGIVWFFQPGNIEMLIKTLDGCGFEAFKSFWVFFAATTNVDFTVTVTDTRSGLSKEYNNQLGDAAEPIQDLVTFTTCSTP